MEKKVPDLIVYGGGLVGVFAALEAHARGLTVAIVEKRVYLGRELAAHNHTFLGAGGGDDDLRRCPEAWRDLFSIRDPRGEILVPEGFLRQELLALLEKRAIPVFFEAEAVGASMENGAISGLLLAAPPGIVWLPGAGVLDASESSSLLRLLSDRPHLESGNLRLHACFELTFPRDASPLLGKCMEGLREAERALALEPESLRSHATLRGDTLNFDYAFQTRPSGERFIARSALEASSREKTHAIVAWLRAQLPELAHGSLSHLGFESQVTRIGEAPLASPVRGLSALPSLGWDFDLGDVAALSRQIQECLSKHEPNKGERGGPVGDLMGPGFRVPAARAKCALLEDDGLAAPLWRVDLAGELDPARTLKSDVCIAGVGAGGGMAMLSCAEQGLSVTALEINREFGGTHATGRVAGYYHGYQGGASGGLARETQTLMAPVADQTGTGGIGHAAILLAKARALGVRILTGTRVCGAVMEGKRLARVLAANEDGLFAVEASVSIDATGDADLAAHAGASYQVGDPKDGMVQTYSMWGAELYPTPSHLATRYLTDPDLFHPDVYSERLRAIRLAQKSNSPFHIAAMITPRESRRIKGDASLTVGDLLRESCPNDVVAVAHTPADSHAYTSSDLARIGSIGGGKLLKVRIPYGVFLPEGIEGLLVAAKAFSGERDATSFCRMNADIKNAGYALGLAAAMAIRGATDLRSIDVGKLQEELKAHGVLPDWAFQAGTPEAPEVRVAKLLSDGLGGLEGVVHLEAEEALPCLVAEWKRLPAATGGGTGKEPFADAKALLAMALCWHGSDLGAEHLRALLARAVQEGRHLTAPHRSIKRLFVSSTLAGEDDYSLVNRLLICAGRSASAVVVPPLALAVSQTPGPGDAIPLCMPYDRLRGDIVSEPFYVRLMAIASSVERLADPALATAMEALLRREGVTGYDTPMGSPETPRYMLAHLEISLARSAARCGSAFGREILSHYAADTHVFFRRHAKNELARAPSAANA
ncbi:MAG: FAD-dependent oxidoreductase [Spirochaetes bacterium]|nr:FAD-dependent oxidoreductase [Spirochaetota bacterium]